MQIVGFLMQRLVSENVLVQPVFRYFDDKKVYINMPVGQCTLIHRLFEKDFGMCLLCAF